MKSRASKFKPENTLINFENVWDFETVFEARNWYPITDEIEVWGWELFPKQTEGNKPNNIDIDDDEDLEPEMVFTQTKTVYLDDGWIMELELSSDWLEALKQIYFPEMKYFFNIGFNLLIYGIGSKWQFIEHLVLENTEKYGMLKVVINAYHPGSMFKSILNRVTAEINKIYI